MSAQLIGRPRVTVIPGYRCYSCGEPATHEIQHRGVWLDVCDDPACTGEEPRGANRWQDRDADDAGVPMYGEI